MILLINDDGIKAPGLRVFAADLRRVTGQAVLVVAPHQQCSGQAHAITLDRGLMIESCLEEDFFGFAIDGTPVDCLKLALKVLCKTPPRLVVSGINAGPNIGRSLFYSGTVAVAMEAAVEGQAAIAVSMDHGDGGFAEASGYAARFVRQCLGVRRLGGMVMNLNLPGSPAGRWRPLAMVHHGLSGFAESYSAVQSGSRIAWRLSGQRVELDGEGDTDAHRLAAGHPTLSVLRPDYNVDAGVLGQRLTQRLAALAAGE